MRTLAITGNVPQDSIVAGPGVDPAVKAQVRQALLDFNPKALFGRDSLGDTQRISRFWPVSDDTYAPLRQAIEADQALEAQDSAPGRSKR